VESVEAQSPSNNSASGSTAITVALACVVVFCGAFSAVAYQRGKRQAGRNNPPEHGHVNVNSVFDAGDATGDVSYEDVSPYEQPDPKQTRLYDASAVKEGRGVMLDNALYVTTSAVVLENGGSYALFLSSADEHSA
jgi:hypothetical protein